MVDLGNFDLNLKANWTLKYFKMILGSTFQVDAAVRKYYSPFHSVHQAKQQATSQHVRTWSCVTTAKMLWGPWSCPDIQVRLSNSNDTSTICWKVICEIFFCLKNVMEQYLWDSDMLIFFPSRYGFLLLQTSSSQDALSLSVAILQQFNVPPEMYRVGYTKLFFRTGQAISFSLSL